MEKSEKMINITPKGDKVIVEIREGAAMPLKEPVALICAGQIDAISRYVSQRGNIDKKIAVILINRDLMQIVFTEIPNYAFSTKITGKLELSSEFKAWEINQKKTYTPEELADFIKMHRSQFEKKADAAKLVTELRSFTAKVTKDIEDKNDKRGNVDLVRRQVVESNLPESFKLKIPIFKGQQEKSLDIEVNVDPRSLECYLISADAQEIIDNTKNEIMDAELDKLSGFCIIEQ
jgi:hypothetical protein